MTEQARVAELLERLKQAVNQTEKAAIVAEMAIAQLDPLTAMIARRCVILRWFDASVVQAFIDHDVEDAPNEMAVKITATLADLPFIETLSWGLAYHEQTRDGLLAQVIDAGPEFLCESAALAVPAYRSGEDEAATGEALYCLVVAGEQVEAEALLDAQLVDAGKRQDWQRLAAIFNNIKEAESLPFVDRMALSAFHWLARGLARKAQGDLDAAIADYDRAIALNPDDAIAYGNRGLARYDQGDLDAAIADYDQVIALNPDDAIAYGNRGNARYDQGDLDAAIADYDRAIALNPDDATAYNNRGLARKAQGDLDAAIADYDRAIALNPDDAIAYNNRGLARKAQGDLDAAIADYDQVIALNPDDAIAYSGLGTVLRQLERVQEAEAAHGRAVELDAARLIDWSALADLARRRDDSEAWQRAIDMARPLVDTNDTYNAACFESIAGHAEVALNLLEQALAEHPGMAAWAKNDPDLHWIREEPRFAEIVKDAERGDAES